MSARPLNFQGQAVYFTKTKMELGNWGARLSEAQKKQIEARLKNRLEKTYVLNFNREESVFNEEEKFLPQESVAPDQASNSLSRSMVLMHKGIFPSSNPFSKRRTASLIFECPWPPGIFRILG